MADVDNNHGAFSHMVFGNLVNAVLKSAANSPSEWASKMNISFDGGDTWKFLEKAMLLLTSKSKQKQSKKFLEGDEN